MHLARLTLPLTMYAITECLVRTPYLSYPPFNIHNPLSQGVRSLWNTNNVAKSSSRCLHYGNPIVCLSI
jgi:hypothetical protein